MNITDKTLKALGARKQESASEALGQTIYELVIHGFCFLITQKVKGGSEWLFNCKITQQGDDITGSYEFDIEGKSVFAIEDMIAVAYKDGQKDGRNDIRAKYANLMQEEKG